MPKIVNNRTSIVFDEINATANRVQMVAMNSSDPVGKIPCIPAFADHRQHSGRCNEYVGQSGNRPGCQGICRFRAKIARSRIDLPKMVKFAILKIHLKRGLK